MCAAVKMARPGGRATRGVIPNLRAGAPMPPHYRLVAARSMIIANCPDKTAD